MGAAMVSRCNGWKRGLDDHEGDGMNTKRTYHGWQMDGDRSSGMRCDETDE